MHPLERSLGYRFNDHRYLERAITRRAYADDHRLPDDSCQDDLAALGDAVISTVVLKRAISVSNNDGGENSEQKAGQMRGPRLTEVARRMGLQKEIRWGAREVKQEVWLKDKPLGECLEAIIGAIFLDGGLDCCESVLRYIRFAES
jgi:ribonuclease-3